MSFVFLALWMTGILISGCTPPSYSGDDLKRAVIEITRKEYGIENCDVKVVGTTFGVFLPLSQLFSMDFKEAILSGQVTDMEQLFQPTEEAIDKIEDVLFSMSRVILSTDRKIDFYFLQATDIEKTGMEINFIGHSDDIKRVRFWDIPRSEYRKRIIHEMQLNRPVLWHRPVKQFFNDLNEKTRSELKLLYFKNLDDAKWEEEFFLTSKMGASDEKGARIWEVIDVRSLPVEDREVVVYAKVNARPRDGQGAPQVLDYLFQIFSRGGEEKIDRITPMSVLDQTSADLDAPMTRDMIYSSLERWDEEFSVLDMTLGEFLAMQLSRRMQMAFSQDERVYNTFSEIKAVFQYVEGDPGHFVFHMTAPLKDIRQKAYTLDQGVNEDVIYAWNLATREFVNVLRGYSFKDWEFLSFSLTQAPSYTWTANQQDLELYRRMKKPLQDILTLTPQVAS